MKLLRTQGDLDQLHRARESMSAAFPLTEGILIVNNNSNKQCCCPRTAIVRVCVVCLMNVEQWQMAADPQTKLMWAVSPPRGLLSSTPSYYHQLLLSPKASIHLTIPWMIEDLSKSNRNS